MMAALCAVLCLLWLVPVLYLVCLGAGSLGLGGPGTPVAAAPSAQPAPRTAFAVIVPARNEERVIGRLLDSLKHQDYPAELVEIAVVTNGCTDGTEDVCAARGVKVMAVGDVATKGDALKRTFARYAGRRDIDAFVVFDADNVVDPGFLSAADRALRAGCSVCQGMRLAANGSVNFVSRGYEAYYAIQNYLFNMPRTQRGLSSSINGSAFAVSKRLIDAGWFDVKTFIEDMEFAGICALRGERIGFVEDAVTYDEQPTKLSTSWIQRRRWSTGLNQCRRVYARRLLACFRRSGWAPALDMLLLYASPVVNVACAAAFAGSVALQALWPQGVCPSFALGCAVAAGSWLGCIVLTALSLAHLHAGLRRSLVAGAVHVPIFLLTWMAIDVVTMLRGVTEWKAIEHTGAR